MGILTKFFGIFHNTEPTKACTKCGRIMPLSDFHRDKSKADGRSTVCISCKNTYRSLVAGTKTCAKCGQTLPMLSFSASSKAADGRQAYCKACAKQAEEERRAKKAMEEAERMAAASQGADYAKRLFSFMSTHAKPALHHAMALAWKVNNLVPPPIFRDDIQPIFDAMMCKARAELEQAAYTPKKKLAQGQLG